MGTNGVCGAHGEIQKDDEAEAELHLTDKTSRNEGDVPAHLG